MLLSIRWVGIPTVALLLSAFPPVSAGDTPDFTFKPRGVSLELLTQERELDIQELNIAVPGLDSAAASFIKNQTGATDKTQAANLRVDYQVRPYLNVFGSAGSLNDNVKVDFSSLGLGLPNLDVETHGVLYGAGFTLMGRDENLLGALTYVHHVADLDDSGRKMSADTLMPTLGIQTKAGVLSASLDWQNVDDNYAGTVSLPGIGAVPVEVSTKNHDAFAYSVGLHTRLAKDLYLSADAGLGNRQHAMLMLNQRF